MAVYIWLALISIPMIATLIPNNIGLIRILIEHFYFYPVAWIGLPHFESIEEIGASIPNTSGRLIGLGIYSAVYWVLVKIVQSRISNDRS